MRNEANVGQSLVVLDKKFLITLLTLYVGITVGWLSWLSLQSISMDKSTLLSANNINQIAEAQKETTIILKALSERQQELRIQVSENKWRLNQKP